MTMSTEPDNFEPLRRLLALKRHEQPPPGYFEQLSSEIHARLLTGEHRQTDWWQELGDEASWLQRFWAALSAKPALAGAFGLVVCSLVLTGIYYSQETQMLTTAASPTVETWKPEPQTHPLVLSDSSPAKTDVSSSSTNPVLNTGPSLFDQIGVVGRPATVNFSPGGN
jgi:hypothetical protein